MRTMKLRPKDRRSARTSNHGFTLIEMAIVIAVIGLVVGGVFVGRDLIEAANLRRTISQKERFDAAANAFRSKYNCMAGDCATASRFGFINLFSATPIGGGYTTNGTGDGRIGPITVIGNEFIHFWFHLIGANLIPADVPNYGKALHLNPEGVGLRTPRAPLILSPASVTIPISGVNPLHTPVTGPVGGWYVFSPGSGYHTAWWQTWTSSGYLADMRGGNWYGLLHGVNSTTGVVRASTAYSLDAKIDDGVPTTGTVRAVGGLMLNAGLVFWGPTAASAQCANTTAGSERYMTTRDPTCVLIVRASF